MPKKKFDVETEAVSFRLPVDTLALIDSLVGTLYGSSRADVARSLIQDRLKAVGEECVIPCLTHWMPLPPPPLAPGERADAIRAGDASE